MIRVSNLDFADLPQQILYETFSVTFDNKTCFKAKKKIIKKEPFLKTN
jgi:hypothetical protein